MPTYTAPRTDAQLAARQIAGGIRAHPEPASVSDLEAEAELGREVSP